METLFRLSNLLVLPFWGLMIAAPRWRWTERIVRSPFVIAAPATVYLALLAPRLSEIWPAVARPSLTGIAALLGSSAGATIAWFHFLAFDLFVGRWIYLEAQERRMNAWLVSPILFLTLMVGPVGFLAYLLLRAFMPASDKIEPSQNAREDRRGETSAGCVRMARAGASFARDSITRAFAMNRPLTISALLMLVVLAATLVGIVLDPRVITGAPAWLKPAKFAISISIYSFTVVWLLGFVQNRPRLVRLIANVTAAGLLAEMAIIVAQAARGTTSHFNLSTPLNASLWLTMGIVIVLVWAMSLVLALLLTFQPMQDGAFALSLRLGVFICAVGMGVAFLMTRPTRAQLTTIATHGPRIAGAHTVGVSDGGSGLPVVGWSTVGGDLRVAHFVGLHALQVLPFLGWLITRRRGTFSRLTDGQRGALVWTSGMAYFGMVLLLTWQALRGQPLIHPDFKTLTAAGLLAAGVAIAIMSIALRPYIRGNDACSSSAKPVPISGGNMKNVVLGLAVLLILSSQASAEPPAAGTPADAAVAAVGVGGAGGAVAGSAVSGAAQPLPDAPAIQAETSSNPNPSQADKITSNPPAPSINSQSAQPISANGNAGLRVGEKFRYYASETYFNPAAIIGPAFRAGIRMANPPGKGVSLYPREWRQGAEALGRNYGDAVAERTSFNTARFVSGVILREDPRYAPSNSRNVFARSLHAMSFTFLDRSDSGRCRPALANFVGAAAGGFVGNAYLPAGFNNLTHAGQRAALQLGFVAGGNLFREFAPQMPAPLRSFFMLIGRRAKP